MSRTLLATLVVIFTATSAQVRGAPHSRPSRRVPFKPPVTVHDEDQGRGATDLAHQRPIRSRSGGEVNSPSNLTADDEGGQDL